MRNLLILLILGLFTIGFTSFSGCNRTKDLEDNYAQCKTELEECNNYVDSLESRLNYLSVVPGYDGVWGQFVVPAGELYSHPLPSLNPDYLTEFYVKPNPVWNQPLEGYQQIFGVWWKSEEGSSTLIKAHVALVYSMEETDGVWSLRVFQEGAPIEIIRLVSFSDFDATYRFKLGFDGTNFILQYYGTPFGATKKVSSILGDVGLPTSYLTPKLNAPSKVDFEVPILLKWE